MKNDSDALNEICRRIETGIEERKRPYLIAIDGRSGSGKSTLAQELSKRYGAGLYHMDDFFLQPFQRTKQRLGEIGGNVDYERFYKEVLLPLSEDRTFTYGIFDCGQQRIVEYRDSVNVSLHIIEGSYSEHPYFGSPYDLTICLDIDAEKQEERIRKRNGEEMLKRFMEEWIPKENAYLDKFHIMERCDICINM